jgi:hypothetical protein
VRDDPVQFLRARLAETAAANENPYSPGAWHAASCASLPDVFGQETSACDCGVPARVLAEVEAKRMLLDSIVPTMNAFEDKIDEEWGTGDGEHASAAFLRAWARVYRDHPDFDPAWLED